MGGSSNYYTLWVSALRPGTLQEDVELQVGLFRVWKWAGTVVEHADSFRAALGQSGKLSKVILWKPPNLSKHKAKLQQRTFLPADPWSRGTYYCDIISETQVVMRSTAPARGVCGCLWSMSRYKSDRLPSTSLGNKVQLTFVFTVPPKISNISSDITVNEGSNVTLVCMANGRPEPVITWRHLTPTGKRPNWTWLCWWFVNCTVISFSSNIQKNFQ